MRSVFISATTRGFAELRSTIFQIVRSQGIDPLEQKDLTPEAGPVRAEIEEKISRATGVISLVGPFYGFPMGPPPAEGRARLSYTQHEFRYASTKKKQMLIYIIEDSFFEPDLLAEGHRQEAAQNLPDARHFRNWQNEFRQVITGETDKYGWVSIPSKEALFTRLARIDWNLWPDER
jgi:hypothetical protein